MLTSARRQNVNEGPTKSEFQKIYKEQGVKLLTSKQNRKLDAKFAEILQQTLQYPEMIKTRFTRMAAHASALLFQAALDAGLELFHLLRCIQCIWSGLLQYASDSGYTYDRETDRILLVRVLS